MRDRPLTILISTAHPDDETFGSGGTSALYAARGVRVDILLATSGQAGEINVPELDTEETRANLGRVREAEARAAAEAVGAHGISFLGHCDGALADVPRSDLALEVASEIRRVRPDVVVTFGPDGVYGHPDHVAIHYATTDAFGLAADEATAIDGLPPHAASRLFYQVISTELAERRNRDRGPLMLNGVPHSFTGYPDDEITTFIDATEHVESKIAALACHRTQTGHRIDQIREWLTAERLIERYMLAQSRVPDHDGLSGDLLAGLG